VVGEAVFVGNAILLTIRIILNKPKYRLSSDTIDVWQQWNFSESEM
jgi:hypothetical protein